jgi:hypothetical protein
VADIADRPVRAFQESAAGLVGGGDSEADTGRDGRVIDFARFNPLR